MEAHECISGAIHSAMVAEPRKAPTVTDMREPSSPYSPIEIISLVRQRNQKLEDIMPVMHTMSRFVRQVHDLVLGSMSLPRMYNIVSGAEKQLVRQSVKNFHSCFELDHSTDHVVVKCCELAALIARGIIDDMIPFSETAVENHVKNLQSFLKLTDQRFWIKYAPETLIWICLTAAAASRDKNCRGWFIVRFGPSIMVASHAISVMKKAWVYYCWMEELCEERRRGGGGAYGLLSTFWYRV